MQNQLTPKPAGHILSRVLQALLLPLLLLGGRAAWACTVCRPRVQAGIHDQQYAANLLVLLVPVAVLLLLGLGVYFFDDVKQRFASAHD